MCWGACHVAQGLDLSAMRRAWWVAVLSIVCSLLRAHDRELAFPFCVRVRREGTSIRSYQVPGYGFGSF